MPDDAKAGEIRKLRSELGLTRQEMADMLEVSRAEVRGWEQGERAPSPAHQVILKKLRERAQQGDEGHFARKLLEATAGGGVAALLMRLFSSDD